MDKSYKIWGVLSPEEKKTLLLAHYEKKGIELWDENIKTWVHITNPKWFHGVKYRVKPTHIGRKF